jgi:hypothetical protein
MRIRATDGTEGQIVLKEGPLRKYVMCRVGEGAEGFAAEVGG